MNIAEKLLRAKTDLDDVFEAGKKAADNGEFWDGIQTDGTKTVYDYAFYGAGWTNDNFKPKYPIAPTSANYMFAYSKITDLTKYDIDLTKLTTGTYMFRNSGIKKIGTVKCADMRNLFYACQASKIEKVILPDVSLQTISSFFTGTFTYFYLLEEIDFEGYFGQNINARDSWNLTTHSIVNFVEHLSDDITGKTLTLSSGAVSDADWSITNYSSFEDLVNSKPNWTISLVG